MREYICYNPVIDKAAPHTYDTRAHARPLWCWWPETGPVGRCEAGGSGEHTLPMQLCERRWSLDNSEQRRRPEVVMDTSQHLQEVGLQFGRAAEQEAALAHDVDAVVLQQLFVPHAPQPPPLHELRGLVAAVPARALRPLRTLVRRFASVGPWRRLIPYDFASLAWHHTAATQQCGPQRTRHPYRSVACHSRSQPRRPASQADLVLGHTHGVKSWPHRELPGNGCPHAHCDTAWSACTRR